MNRPRIDEPLGTLAGRSCEWRTHAPWSRPRWELLDGDRTLVALSRAHWYGTRMDAEVEGAHWRLGRIGWRDLALTLDDASPPVLTYRGLLWSADEDTQRLKLSRWRGDGPIQRADGRRWFWRQHGFIRDRHWEVLDERERALVTITRIFRPFKIEGHAHFGDAAESRAEALEAAVFGWYLLLRESAHRRHAAH